MQATSGTYATHSGPGPSSKSQQVIYLDYKCTVSLCAQHFSLKAMAFWMIFALKFPSPCKDLANHVGHHKFWWSVKSDLKLASNAGPSSQETPLYCLQYILDFLEMTPLHSLHCLCQAHNHNMKGGGVKKLHDLPNNAETHKFVPQIESRYSKWNSGVLFSDDSTLQDCKFKNYTNGPSFWLRMKMYSSSTT